MHHDVGKRLRDAMRNENGVIFEVAQRVFAEASAAEHMVLDDVVRRYYDLAGC